MADCMRDSGKSWSPQHNADYFFSFFFFSCTMQSPRPIKVRYIQIFILTTRNCFKIHESIYTMTQASPMPSSAVPAGSPSHGGDVTVYVWHKPTKLAHSFLFCFCVDFFLYGPFNCISFHKFSQQLSIFWLCSSGLISALLVLSIISYEDLLQPYNNP